MISTSFGHCWIKFENGYTISIFNGFGSYSDNHFNHKLFEKMQNLDFQDRLPELMMKVKEGGNIESQVMEVI